MLRADVRRRRRTQRRVLLDRRPAAGAHPELGQADRRPPLDQGRMTAGPRTADPCNASSEARRRMEPSRTRRLGSTAVAVTELGFGGASIGELFVRVSEPRCQRRCQPPGTPASATSTPRPGTAVASRSSGPAPGCATIRGRSSCSRPRSAAGSDRSPTGASTGAVAGWRPNDVVFDYSYDGIMRACEQSQLRLGHHALRRRRHPRPRRPVLRRADDRCPLRLACRRRGWRALEELGSAARSGPSRRGSTDLGLIPRLLEIGPIDSFLIAMPYTLLRQEVLDEEFPACVERGVGFVIGAPFQSGILAKGRGAAPIRLRRAPPEVDRAGRAASHAVCERMPCRSRRPRCSSRWATQRSRRSSRSVVARPAGGAMSRRSGTRSRPTLWAELKHEGLLREDAPVPA